jgi:hypothetical protein
MKHGSKAAALLAGIIATMAPISAQADATAQVAGFQAFLFNSGNGTFSPDVIKNQIALGNVVASEYDSVSTFVVVDVESGSDTPLPDTARLRLTATEAGKKGKRVLLDSTQRPKTTGNPGVTHIGFWLPDTGCAVITLRATLIANGKVTAKTATLDFHCYE